MSELSYTEMEVRFDKWCEKCKHFSKSGDEDPCFTCLDHPTNWDSDKPEKFEAK